MSDSTPHSPTPFQFATAQEAETAFYDAFRRRDATAMGALWLEADYVECVHPMGERLRGFAAIMANWRQMFAAEQTMEFEFDDVHYTQSGSLSIHTLTEHITVPDSDPPVRARMLATNIYQLTASGWRLILHHASPLPRPAAASATLH